MKYKFISNAENSHVKEEETQWAQILAKGNPYAGILLIYDQKLCAFAHEINNAIEKGQIYPSQVKIYASRLKRRVGRILELLDEEPNLASKKIFKGLASKLEELENNKFSYNVLKEFPERIHLASHELCDELYLSLK